MRQPESVPVQPTLAETLEACLRGSVRTRASGTYDVGSF
jgi:hypothetical protein